MPWQPNPHCSHILWWFNVIGLRDAKDVCKAHLGASAGALSEIRSWELWHNGLIEGEFTIRLDLWELVGLAVGGKSPGNGLRTHVLPWFPSVTPVLLCSLVAMRWRSPSPWVLTSMILYSNMWTEPSETVSWMNSSSFGWFLMGILSQQWGQSQSGVSPRPFPILKCSHDVSSLLYFVYLSRL